MREGGREDEERKQSLGNADRGRGWPWDPRRSEALKEGLCQQTFAGMPLELSTLRTHEKWFWEKETALTGRVFSLLLNYCSQQKSLQRPCHLS